jgi:hypothetical protein
MDQIPHIKVEQLYCNADDDESDINDKFVPKMPSVMFDSTPHVNNI